MKAKERENFLNDLKQIGIKNDIPNISITNAHFLRDLIKIKKAKRCLEIGTANGYSAIHMGIELEKIEGKIDTIEFSERSYLLAQDNITEVHLEKTIRQIQGNALDIIPLLTPGYDFVFIDGMKRRTKDFLELVLPLVQVGGVIVIDDVILFREKMKGLHEFLDLKNINYNILPIDVNDGVMMIIK